MAWEPRGNLRGPQGPKGDPGSGGVPSTLTLTAGNGLTGGGDLSQNRAFQLGVPGSITASSVNAVQATSHTHELNKADSYTWTGQHRHDARVDVLSSSVPWGVAPGQGLRAIMGTASSATWLIHGYSGDDFRGGIQLLDSGTMMRLYLGNGKYATLNSAGTWNGHASDAVSVNAGSGLTGGGTIASTRTISLGTPSDITGSSINEVTSLSHTHKSANITTASNDRTVFHNEAGYNATDRASIWLYPPGDSSGTGIGLAFSGAIRVKWDTTGTMILGIVPWDRISGAPTTATRWPTWNEVTGKPSIPQGTVTSVTGGNGLSGTVTSSGSISLGTPGTLSGSTTNSVTSTSHTHALSANLSAWDDLNPNQAMVHRGSLGGGVDLNTLTITGWYYQNMNTNAASGSNYPVNRAGVLEVYETGGMTYQTYTEYSSSTKWTRSRYQSTWYPWAKIWDSGSFNPDSKLNLSAVNVNVSNDTVAQRTSSGDLYARLFRSTYENQTNIPGSAALAFRNNDSNDNYIRFCSNPSAIRGWLNDGSVWRITTNSGYVDIGPNNTGYCHFQTDRPNFYMNRGLQVNGEIAHYQGPRVPKMFIQSGNPGSAAGDGDLWGW